jgi:steroid 5-alpha reductase family enzyme
MEIVEAYKLSSVAVFAMMVGLWAFSLVTRDASIVDRFWGAGFVLIA